MAGLPLACRTAVWRRWRAGEEASAGLLLSSMDQVVEDILLGVINADDVPGAVKSSEIQAPRAMRWFGRGLRRPPQ